MNTARLRDVPLFKDLGRKQMEAIGRIADDLDVAEGKALTRQGDLGHEFFVIEAGRAKVEVDGRHVGDLGPGDFFGEIALIKEERRTASVTATEPMEVMVMTGHAFRSLKRSHPDVYETVAAEIEKRLGAPA